MENFDFLQIDTVNSSLVTLAEQSNFFTSDSLQLPATNLNHSESFSELMSKGIDEVNLKVNEFDQTFDEIFASSPECEAFTTTPQLATVSDNFDPLIGDVSSLLAEVVWDSSSSIVKEELESFAGDAKFVDKMKLAFGDDWQPQEADALIKDLASGETIPKIEILPTANLKADGAFGEGTIYLSENFLSENAANPEALADVLLEEIGHYIDRELNSVDSLGDEGDIFSRLVQGETISDAELKDLKAEGDSTTIGLDGEKIDVELAASEFPGDLFIYEPGNVTYNSDVEAWQQRMSERGWQLAVDGLYGPESESITHQFQQAKDLAVDGIVGKNTWDETFETGTPAFPGDLFIYEPGNVTYNSDVEAWQQRMKDVGWQLAVDGLYGPESESIARQFQEAEEFSTVDGIVGPQTWEASFDDRAATPDTPPPPSDDTPPEPIGNFRENVVAIAEGEWEDFDRGALQEDDPDAVPQIEEYFQSFGEEYTGQAWSAAFISWVMGEAGAGEEFNYSQLHADYINQAIADRESDAAFIGYDIDEYSPQVGDLIGRNRPGEEGGEITVTYNTAEDYDVYNSHVDIVVATRPDEGEIDVIGGNVSDSVSLETYTIDSDGKIINDNAAVDDDWFVVIENRFGEDAPSPAPQPAAPPPESIEFGDYEPVAKAPEFVTDEFLSKVFDISQGLEAVPEYLMAVMGFETGGTYNPAERNPDSSATGLIQFLESTAEALGTSTAELENITAVEQLDYVEQYYSSFTGSLTSLAYTYTAVLAGTTGEDELFVEGSGETGEEYDANAGLDLDTDGVVTAEEAANQVREYLPEPDLFAKYRDSATA